MLQNPETKYRPFRPVDLTDRHWPSRTITKPPRWCSTDLRDGNQALVDPMNTESKLAFFELLVGAGFKEIEVAFPSASDTDFQFVRHLIEERKIPDDVWIQVLTPAREDLIARSFAALRGAPRAIVHLYNATAPAFRRIVFGQDEAATIALAVKGAQLIKQLSAEQPGTDWRFEYSPEVFCLTEAEFAVEICDAVLEIWRPTPSRPAILNLPATVESATPNIYADQIEWFGRRITRRDAVCISVHPHNDRGTAVAAAELAIMAGADRVEGTLFGNGERTGNVDLVTLALNLYTQGVHPGLDFSNMKKTVDVVERCNQLPVHPRHPYAGELVFTAFSGSHQDAIKKGFAAQSASNTGIWEIPYLPIDPADVGASYEAVIRVNSQSGKSGAAWLLERDHGLKLPRGLQIGFSRIVQEVADRTGKELSAAQIWQLFRHAYALEDGQRITLVDHWEEGHHRAGADGQTGASILVDGRERTISGHGNGPVSAFIAALREHCGVELAVVDYQEHALQSGAAARAAAYVECRTADGREVFGVGLDENIVTASIKALVSAANTALRSAFPAG
jgi:2-isopropylmalate synthase